jgi:NAD+ synthase (glutamine-hydrolysing)
MLRIAIAQINPKVGDLQGNVARLLDALEKARAAGAHLLLTPELALSGYPPEDWLLRDDFYTACAHALERLCTSAQGITVVVGHPHKEGGLYYNAASVLRDGQCTHRYYKHRLPNYDVFDEARYFQAGDAPCVFVEQGITIGLNICADLWEGDAWVRAKKAGASVLLTLNASPYHMGKSRTRLALLQERAGETGMAIVYANMVGGQDELVFDGASLAVNAKGELVWQAPAMCEDIGMLDYQGQGECTQASLASLPCDEALAYEALVVGVRDYLGKNGFPGALIGLSGGIDSALTLAVAVDALGVDRVRAVMMPSPYTAQMSLDDSREMVRRLGVTYDEIPIASAMSVFDGLLAPYFAGYAPDVTEENLQSRIRGVILMALSNKTGALVLTTGNKSEMATGYATLYGDMAGGFGVLKDCYKTWVYRMAHWRNTQGASPIIPDNILIRPPSAELRPDQTDQDSLPPYDVLDAILEAFIEEGQSASQIIERGFAPPEVQHVLRLLKRSEYKRRQAPIGVRITRRAFGRDWRYPLTCAYPPVDSLFT